MKHSLPQKRKKVFVAMSGGVDSSVAALLLKRRGYAVIGIFMRCYNLDGCAERDAEDARRVAGRLGIPFYVWDMEAAYKAGVVDYMIRGYRRGLTPNPDVMCNREIKFGLFLEQALQMGADYIATGHYVRLVRRGSALALAAAKDSNKDQSYFLWTLTSAQLRYCLFPIGACRKPQVRVMAAKAGLPTAAKKDSQGICFLGQVSLSDFLQRYLPKRRGAVLNIAGEKIGEHAGAHFYTIGQRQGIGNLKHQPGVRVHVPLYVAAKDIRKNQVVMAEGTDPALYRRELNLREVNIVRPESVSVGERVPVFARVRYRQPVAPAQLRLRSKHRARLHFDKPQKFVAPGQSAVFYTAQGEMLGGGILEEE